MHSLLSLRSYIRETHLRQKCAIVYPMVCLLGPLLCKLTRDLSEKHLRDPTSFAPVACQTSKPTYAASIFPKPGPPHHRTCAHCRATTRRGRLLQHRATRDSGTSILTAIRRHARGAAAKGLL